MLVCPECGAEYPEDTSECPKDGSALVHPAAAATLDPPLAPGTMVGEYRVDRKLGAGAFGAVYSGEQPLIGKKVAVKVLHRKLSAEPEAVSRFIAEARAVNRIRHRNIIDIFSFGTLNGLQHYFVMELCDGETLGQLLDREGRVGLARALPIFRGIAEGLDAAHEAGVTHRDLKPDNVFLAAEKDGSFFPKLLDFGVAKLVEGGQAHKTATGVAMGTPRYMSPEQARGRKVDHRTDIYALGVLIHETLTGRPPFDGESVMDVLMKHMVEPPPPMSRVCPDLPEQLDAPVLAMMAKSASARPGTASGAVAALAEVARRLGLDREAPSGASAGEGGGAEPAVTVKVERPARKAAAAALPEVETEVPQPPGSGTVRATPRLTEVAPAAARVEAALKDTAPARARPWWALAALAGAGAALCVAYLARIGGEPGPRAPLDSTATPAIPAAPSAPPAAAPSAERDEVPLEPAPTLAVPSAPDAGAASGKPPVKRVHKELERPEYVQPAPGGAPR